MKIGKRRDEKRFVRRGIIKKEASSRRANAGRGRFLAPNGKEVGSLADVGGVAGLVFERLRARTSNVATGVSERVPQTSRRAFASANPERRGGRLRARIPPVAACVCEREP
jgi:hypothetical protein